FPVQSSSRPRFILLPYTTLFRSKETDARFVGYFGAVGEGLLALGAIIAATAGFRSLADWEEMYHAFNEGGVAAFVQGGGSIVNQDRKSTRLNSSHVSISYAVCCL